MRSCSFFFFKFWISFWWVLIGVIWFSKFKRIYFCRKGFNLLICLFYELVVLVPKVFSSYICYTFAKIVDIKTLYRYYIYTLHYIFFILHYTSIIYYYCYYYTCVASDPFRKVIRQQVPLLLCSTALIWLFT